ncbi:MAG TPA: anhydro-N-acetylmuramic acid kinase [Phycisphaerae bacterium]|nr:anhydro-N-acetylmuramic acid kinase [Phycisphaerae bacterium]
MSEPRLIIGLMSGTSVDAIDAALVRVGTTPDGRYRAKVLTHSAMKWPDRIRERLLAVMAPAKTTTEEICRLNVVVAEWFARAAFALMGTTDLRSKRIAAIGSHGQTVCHLPRGRVSKDTSPSTLQLGDPSVLATLTGVTVVGDFRPADMAVGGQGAPLVPFADDALLSHPTKTLAVQNIGGIANVTYLPPLHEKNRRLLAFDTGPGNMLLDAMVSLGTNDKKRFDKDGRLAAKGSLDARLFRELQAHPFFDQRPPKSTGREDFGLPFARRLMGQIENRKLKIENLLHTLTRLTAWSIADAYLHFLPEIPDEVILCGGGADNPTLVRMLGEEFSALGSAQVGTPPPKIRRIDEFGIPNKAKEAASFAILAAATLDGRPANLPSVTGASRPVILGVIARPTPRHSMRLSVNSGF